MREAPEWLDRRSLAAHISVGVDALRRLQRLGKLPRPSYHLGPNSPRWRRIEVDAMFTDRMPERLRPTADEAFEKIARKIAKRGLRSV